jgi:hypothetical protein
VGAERVECRHEELSVGQRCPVWGQGNLYELPPGVEIRLEGHALLSALRYELHKLRSQPVLRYSPRRCRVKLVWRNTGRGRGRC